MAKRWDTCSGESLPAVQIAFEKRACIRSKGEQLRSPQEIAAFVSRIYGCKPQEFFVVIHFNVRNLPVAVHEVSMGGIAQTAVDPKVVFGGAMASGASALVLVHNHPSGDPEPSDQDMQLTRQLVEGARLLGLQVLDHIVIARGGEYTSFMERGLMPRTAFRGSFEDEEIVYPRY